MSIRARPFSSATRNATFSTPSCTSFRSSIRDSSSGPISVTVARTGWPCSPNTSQNTVENWSGWKLSPISAARLTIKSLGSPDFGDAGEVSLDVGGEYRNAGARKPLRHHLQRDGFSGAGRAGDEAMAIGERQRQPGRLLTLADENFLVGIGQLVIGGHHCIASSCLASGPTRHHIASCKPIETGSTAFEELESRGSSKRDRPASYFFSAESRNEYA